MKKIQEKSVINAQSIDEFRSNCTCTCLTCFDCRDSSTASALIAQTPTAMDGNFNTHQLSN